MADAVLVTGGAGYIGSHIVVELARVGHQPIVVDNFCNSSPSVIPRLLRITDRRYRASRPTCATSRLVEDVCRACDRGGRALRGTQVGRRGRSAASDLLRQQRWRRYRAGRSDGGGRRQAAGVQFVGSRLRAAGHAIPSAEDAPLRPHSVYGRTKRIVEQLLEDLAAADRSWRIALLRYFNPAGAHASATIGEAPSGMPNNLVPLLAGVAAEKLAEIAIYGDDWPTPDGTGIRDYIHVMDLAAGHVAALAHLASTPGARRAQSRHRTRPLGTRIDCCVRARLRSDDTAAGRAAPARRRRRLLRRSGARRDGAGRARATRHRCHLR